MKSIWDGSINFGLVNIPVRLYSGSTSHEGLDLDMLHSSDHAPIHFKRVCSQDGQEVAFEDIEKGYEYKKGEYVVLSEDDLDHASPHKTKSIRIQQFTGEDEIDSRYYAKPYYLEPDKNAETTYALLRESLKQSGKVAIANYVVRGHENLAVIRPIGNLLVLNQLRWPADVREPSSLNLPDDKPSEAELKMAQDLIKKQTKPFVAEDWHDTYTEELRDLIESKQKGKKTYTKKPGTKPTEVKDVMSALKASLEKSG